MAVTSPFFKTLPLQQHGLEWAWPLVELAHPLDDGTAVIVERDVARTASQFGGDAAAYRKLYEPLVANWNVLAQELLGPLGIPRHPLLVARFGLNAVQPAARLAKSVFENARARALFAGMAAHSTLPMGKPDQRGIRVDAWARRRTPWAGRYRAVGHDLFRLALESVLTSLGGKIFVNSRVDRLPGQADVSLCDFTPLQLLEMSRVRLPESFRRSLQSFQYGPGVYKVDWALREPIPWKAKECQWAGTVHLGGSLEEISHSEKAVNHGQLSALPFVILAQPSLFDQSRAPKGEHTAWAYCHVPNGFAGSALDLIETQIERFAPGFRECVLARAEHSPAAMQQWNENLIGGDINGGATDWKQFVFRPTRMRYRTPLPGVFFCSSSTPPGGGVHGMCGYWGAEAALRYLKIT